MVFHFFYYSKGYGRFYDPALFATFLLAARGVIECERFINTQMRIQSFGIIATILVIIPVVYSLLFINIPIYLNDHKQQSVLLDPFAIVCDQKITQSVVFLRSVPEAWNNIGCYIQNSPDFSDSVLFAKDLKSKNIHIMNYYPNRSYYVYEFDRQKSSGRLTQILNKWDSDTQKWKLYHTPKL